MRVEQIRALKEMCFTLLHIIRRSGCVHSCDSGPKKNRTLFLSVARGSNLILMLETIVRAITPQATHRRVQLQRNERSLGSILGRATLEVCKDVYHLIFKRQQSKMPSARLSLSWFRPTTDGLRPCYIFMTGVPPILGSSVPSLYGSKRSNSRVYDTVFAVSCTW